MGRESNLIDYSPCGTERFDDECDNCGSDNVLRSDTFDLEELEATSVWCDDCGYGWMVTL